VNFSSHQKQSPLSLLNFCSVGESLLTGFLGGLNVGLWVGVGSSGRVFLGFGLVLVVIGGVEL